MAFSDEFKIGERFKYLGTRMLVVSLPVTNQMIVHYMSGAGELKQHIFDVADFEAVIAHIKDMDEYYKGLMKTMEEST